MDAQKGLPVGEVLTERQELGLIINTFGSLLMGGWAGLFMGWVGSKPDTFPQVGALCVAVAMIFGLVLQVWGERRLRGIGEDKS